MTQPMNDVVQVWNELSYLDGLVFTFWIALIYVGKKFVDKKFK